MNERSRESILRKLGLTEQDVKDSEKLFRQMPPPPPPSRAYCLKEEELLGYTMLRLKRSKALRVLGASEEDVDVENAKNLGSLGRSGRRRSFFVHESSMSRRVSDFGFYTQKSKSSRRISKKYSLTKSSSTRFNKKSLRRRSTGDLLSLKRAVSEVTNLKKRNNDANAEIIRLKQRVENLEKEFNLKNR